MIGQTISHYRIIDKLGQGGMGVVYKAEDTKLKRTVALKFLPPELTRDPEVKQRFIHEAQAASALQHNNVATIHEINETDDGQMFICMDCYDGEILKDKIQKGPLTIEEGINIAIQIAQGLKKAHRRGIVHRDIKPANIFITKDGIVKILDFGLAKLAGQVRMTKTGTTIGTVAYMPPEQAKGEKIDQRSDIWSLGVVLYEMLTGLLPFQGDYEQAIIYAIMNNNLIAPKELQVSIPEELNEIILHALQKNPDKRFTTVTDFLDGLKEFQSVKSVEPATLNVRSFIRAVKRPRVVFPIIVVLLALGFFTVMYLIRSARVRWARYEALPEIERLVQEYKQFDAYFLIKKAYRYIPDDPQLNRFMNMISFQRVICSTPSGADVYFNNYLDINGEWRYLGRTPIEEIRVPDSYLRFRITKEGYEESVIAVDVWQGDTLRMVLMLEGEGPPNMIHIPKGRYSLGSGQSFELDDYWIDKFEVTNREYKEFIEAGGYRTREYWKHPFIRDDRILSWEEAMAEFLDATGRPGPSTWQLGTYPEGRAEYPVSGVSWHEANAYAEYAGKSLPTIYHWRKAAGYGLYSEILNISNFDGKGPAPVGIYQGITPFGTYDMAGNVKEWCWNEGGGKRYILGGCWNDPEYMFSGADARIPFERTESDGFRCAQYTETLSKELIEPITTFYHDFRQEKPVNDEIFQIYKSLYAYDRTDLDARIESVDDISEHFRIETITFDAAYGNERVKVYLFIPKNVKPPYQTVVYFPGSSARYLKTSEYLLEKAYITFIPRSGRAFLYPVYKGTYERGGGERIGGAQAHRDQWIMRGKDLRRCIDYLETREDIDADKIAFFGLSWGAENGPIFTAIEDRFKASVLLSGGLYDYFLIRPPEVNPLHFCPRSKIPVLMINGRYDFYAPVETSLEPMIRLMGVSEKDKRLVLFDGGHIPAMNDIIRETLDWLDLYLGPVK